MLEKGGVLIYRGVNVWQVVDIGSGIAGYTEDIVLQASFPNGTYISVAAPNVWDEIQKAVVISGLYEKMKRKIDAYFDNQEKLDILGELGKGPTTVGDFLDKVG